MILLTPTNGYNPLGARDLLLKIASRYRDDDIVSQAMLELYQVNTIVRGRYGLYGRNIPGRNFLVSDK